MTQDLRYFVFLFCHSVAPWAINIYDILRSVTMSSSFYCCCSFCSCFAKSLGFILNCKLYVVHSIFQKLHTSTNLGLVKCRRVADYRARALAAHSSEIRGLRSTKCSSETLQNLLYFMYKKTHVVFFVFHFVQLYIFTLSIFVGIEQGIHKVKI